VLNAVTAEAILIAGCRASRPRLPEPSRKGLPDQGAVAAPWGAAYCRAWSAACRGWQDPRRWTGNYRWTGL